MEISRENLDGTWNAVHRTEVINNNLNPRIVFDSSRFLEKIMRVVNVKKMATIRIEFNSALQQ